MTREEHRQRHVELHRALDQLFADYIQHHPDEQNFLAMPLKQLIDWSFMQTISPDELQSAALSEGRDKT